MSARTASATTAPPGRLPAAYMWWAIAAGTSTLGTSAFDFAMTWYATGISAGLTGLIGVLITLPTAALLLVGGAVADRFGIRRLLIAGDTVMLLLSVFVVLAAAVAGVHPWLLIVVAIASGVEGAFYLPASGVVPRLFVTGDDLPRATAFSSTLAALARIAGPACGALLVTVLAFAGTAAVDAVTFALIVLVLWRIRPPYEHVTSAADSGLSILRPLGTVWRSASLRPVLVATGAIAAAVLPAVIYGPSLLARGSGWGPGASGLVEAGWLVGGIAVTAVIARRGTVRRIRLAVGIGLLIIAAGLLGTAVCPSPVSAFGCMIGVGVGVSVCTGHLWPAYLAATPMDQLGRYQSLLVFVQMATLLVATVFFTSIAGGFGARSSLGCCAAVMWATLAWWCAAGSPSQQVDPDQDQQH